jgi:hypothetical protein
MSSEVLALHEVATLKSLLSGHLWTDVDDSPIATAFCFSATVHIHKPSEKFTPKTRP